MLDCRLLLNSVQLTRPASWLPLAATPVSSQRGEGIYLSLAFHLLALSQAAVQHCSSSVSACHETYISSVQQHEYYEPAGCCCRIADAVAVRDGAAEKSAQLQYDIEDLLKSHGQLRSLIKAQAQHQDTAQQLEQVTEAPPINAAVHQHAAQLVLHDLADECSQHKTDSPSW